jgi:hypothetical protein
LHHRDLEKSATPQGIKAYASRVGWGSTYPNGLMR